MATSNYNTSLKVSLYNHIADTNQKLQKLVSTKSIPMWVNPNNTNFYEMNPYKAGDIVILLSDTSQIYYLLRQYYQKIATNLGLDSSMFEERNNPELDNSIIDTLIYGGFLTEDLYINPMTMVSDSPKGFSLFISMKDNNYDVPGASDSWFNLDMSESLDSMELQIARIISILTAGDYVTSVTGQVPANNVDDSPFGSLNGSYLDNRQLKHNVLYHFGKSAIGYPDTSEEALDKLDEIQAQIESNTNTTTSVMKNPFIFNGEVVGHMTTIFQTTGQMFFYCVLDTTNLPKEQNLTINFTPNNISNIIVPIVLQTNDGIIEVDYPEQNPHVYTEDDKYAWFVDSFISISNDSNTSNNIIIETNVGYQVANFNTNFAGFLDNSYIVTYTPIGIESRTKEIAIHCSPVREISRSQKSLTFQLRSDFVWEYNGIAISITGKCEV